MIKLFINMIAQLLFWIEEIVIYYAITKFALKFSKLLLNKNYQDAKQLGEDIKDKYDTDNIIYNIIKDSCLKVLNSDEHSDDAKVIAIKVLSGLKST